MTGKKKILKHTTTLWICDVTSKKYEWVVSCICKMEGSKLCILTPALIRNDLDFRGKVVIEFAFYRELLRVFIMY